MPASEQGLKFLAADIKRVNRELRECGKAWVAEARCCDHSINIGGDWLGCEHPDISNGDPFCYSTRCPLLQ